jgi:PEP-CTERM motif
MKRFVLASAVLVAAIGAASADTIVTSSAIRIWNAPTPGSNSGSAGQQGLPTATGLFGGPLGLIAAGTAFAQPINYNDVSGADTIGGFFASDTPAAPVPSTCNASCAATTLSLPNFAQATVMEFVFSVGNGSVTITHDDGISLFRTGTENLTNSNNLIPGNSAPTVSVATTIALAAGTYDLWYSEANGLPAVLQVTTTNAVPEPATWGMMLLGFLGLGFAFRQSRRKVSFA